MIRFLPGLAVLRHYDRSWLRYDLVAGVSVAAVAVPIAIAYSQLAGVPTRGIPERHRTEHHRRAAGPAVRVFPGAGRAPSPARTLRVEPWQHPCPDAGHRCGDLRVASCAQAPGAEGAGPAGRRGAGAADLPLRRRAGLLQRGLLQVQGQAVINQGPADVRCFLLDAKPCTPSTPPARPASRRSSAAKSPVRLMLDRTGLVDRIEAARSSRCWTPRPRRLLNPGCDSVRARPSRRLWRPAGSRD